MGSKGIFGDDSETKRKNKYKNFDFGLGKPSEILLKNSNQNGFTDAETNPDNIKNVILQTRLANSHSERSASGYDFQQSNSRNRNNIFPESAHSQHNNSRSYNNQSSYHKDYARDKHINDYSRNNEEQYFRENRSGHHNHNYRPDNVMSVEHRINRDYCKLPPHRVTSASIKHKQNRFCNEEYPKTERNTVRPSTTQKQDDNTIDPFKKAPRIPYHTKKQLLKDFEFSSTPLESIFVSKNKVSMERNKLKEEEEQHRLMKRNNPTLYKKKLKKKFGKNVKSSYPMTNRGNKVKKR